MLNSRHKDFVEAQDNSIFLTTRRNIARAINNEKLDLLEGEEYLFEGTVSGRYEELKYIDEERLENKLPAPNKLRLKRNAQIMMLRNDIGKRWVNGSIGKVIEIKKDEIIVKINGKKHSVEREIWNDVEYVLNKKTNEIDENILASFAQYPIQLAYAMTIHKGQGKTFENITVDVGRGAFAHGQIYVALSRCKALNGITLNNPISNNDIIVDSRIVDFYNNKTIT
ncbi:MAG: hypothetical protein V3V16_10610 [Melioribacteraceae bacterium]